MVIRLGRRAIFDLPTAAMGLLSLAVLWRFRVHEPIVVTAAGLTRLAVWSFVHGAG